MSRQKLTRTASFRTVAGALTAFMVVMAYSTVGFLVIAIKVVTGQDVAPQEAWMAGMSTLASAGLGYLIGHQVGSSRVDYTPATPLTPVAMGCDKAGCPLSKEIPPYESS